MGYHFLETVPFTKISRRFVLQGVIACAASGVSVSNVLAVTGNDPLLDAISAYRTGAAQFEAIREDDWPLHGGENVVIEKTYGAPLEALENWDQPALSMRSAIEALRFAHEENQAHFSNPTVVAMVAAALGYFETQVAI